MAAEFNLAVNVVWSLGLILLGNVQPEPGMPLLISWGGVFEVLEFAILMGIPGFLLGLLGGFAKSVLGGRSASAAG